MADEASALRELLKQRDAELAAAKVKLAEQAFENEQLRHALEHERRITAAQLQSRREG